MEPEWDELEEFRLRKIIELAPFSSWQQKTELFNMIASVDHRPIRSQSGVKQKHQRAILPALTQPVPVATTYSSWPPDPSRNLPHESSASNPWSNQVVTTASVPSSARNCSSTDPQAATEIVGTDWLTTMNAVSFGSMVAEPVTTGNRHIVTSPLVAPSPWISYPSSGMTGGQPSAFIGSIPIQYEPGQPSTFINPNQIQHELGQLGTSGLMKEDDESKEEAEDGPEEQDGSEDDNTDEEEEVEEEEEDNG